MAAKQERLVELLQPVIDGLGFELWGLEYLSSGKHSTLRIYIERDSGITVDDCALVSHQVSGVLDVEDPIASEYTLEVSSPGMDRPLYTLEQFQRYVGSTVKVRLRLAVEGKRSLSGLIAAVEGDEVVVRVGDKEFLLPIETIEKAKVVPQF